MSDQPIVFKNPEDGYFTKSVIRIGQYVEAEEYDFTGDQEDYDVEVTITKKVKPTKWQHRWNHVGFDPTCWYDTASFMNKEGYYIPVKGIKPGSTIEWREVEVND